jgi:hypothetical protein
MDISQKRGDTFDYVYRVPEADYPNGYFLGWDVHSQIRTPSGRFIADLEVTWLEPEEETRLLRLFFANTTRWPIGEQEIDVQFTRQSDGVVQSSKTIPLEIIRDVTILPEA